MRRSEVPPRSNTDLDVVEKVKSQRSPASKDFTSAAYLIRILGRQGFIVRVRVPSSMLHGCGQRGGRGSCPGPAPRSNTCMACKADAVERP